MDGSLFVLQLDPVTGLRVAFASILTWPTIGFLVLGVIMGMVFGILPGLGGVVALVILLPITLVLEITHMVAMFGGVLGAAVFAGSITAILINTPGTAPNAATIIDGYPLARQGRATEAITTSASSSALGAIVGLIIFALLIPFINLLILEFGSAEIFILTFFGLVVIAIAVRGALLSGLIAGSVGLLLSYVGYNQMTGVPRYTFGTVFLYDGISFIPVMVGVFAVSEAIHLAITESKISQVEPADMQGDLLKGLSNPIRHPVIFSQSAIVGFLVGIIPGVGGAVANFVSYTLAVSVSNDKSQFGKGDIRGLIASEASNDAKDGGSLLPTLALGIPGSGVMVLLLSAFVIQGQPVGPSLFVNSIDLVYLLVAALICANIASSTFGTLLANQLKKITQIEPKYLVPIIIVLVFIGAFAYNEYYQDIIVAAIFGVIGFYMKRHDYSRIALVIAMILGEMTEVNFHRVSQLGGAEYFFSQPIAVGMFVIMILLLLFSFRGPLLRMVPRPRRG